VTGGVCEKFAQNVEKFAQNVEKIRPKCRKIRPNVEKFAQNVEKLAQNYAQTVLRRKLMYHYYRGEKIAQTFGPPPKIFNRSIGEKSANLVTLLRC
jgi:hypothetical protein